jgi:hypothetical protein
MHIFLQPSDKSRRNISAETHKLNGNRTSEINLSNSSHNSNVADPLKISTRIPHNFSQVPSFGLLISTCRCEECPDSDDAGEIESRNSNPNSLQSKLTVSQPEDSFEQEADQVAEEVMQMPVSGELEVNAKDSAPPSISRWSDHSGVRREKANQEQEESPESMENQEEQISESDLLSLKGRSNKNRTPTAQVAEQIRSIHGGGKPLEPELRNFFEPRFQRDFGNVRIHTDARAAETTHALNAKAYTLGADIAISPAEYRPETIAGRKLLAHELTHVVQQTNQVQTIMRACNCPSFGATDPSSGVVSTLSAAFPHLKTGDYCVTAPATRTYNCFAWSVSNTSSWMDTVIDRVYGNHNGTLEFSDFDSMYALGGLVPVTDATPSNAEVALYAKGNTPTHAARKTGTGCGAWESKLGGSVRISHEPWQLEGGSVYGDINRYYVPQ